MTKTIIAALVVTAVSSTAHAFDRLPAGSQALVDAARTLNARQAAQASEARLILAQADVAAQPGLNVIFSSLGRAGRVAPVTADTGAVGTYTVTSLSASEVVFQLATNLITGTLTITVTAPGQARIRFVGTAGGQPQDVTAEGGFTYDAATRTGTIAYGTSRETFTATATGMNMTLATIPHVFLRN